MYENVISNCNRKIEKKTKNKTKLAAKATVWICSMKQVVFGIEIFVGNQR